MGQFHQVLIVGYPSGGLMTDQKPLMLPDEAFSNLQNAYVFRKRVKKRDGTVAMGRLRRFFSNASIGNLTVVGGMASFNIYSSLTSQTYFPIIPETNAEIAEGTVSITVTGVAHPYIDQGNGILTNASVGNSGKINYLTGNVILTTTASNGAAATIIFGYYPSLPSMGIWKRDVSVVGIDITFFFDTKYAYQYVAGGFQEVVPGQTWTGPNNSNGTNTYFFWSCNYQGATPDLKYFFTTNNNITGGTFDPIYYYNNSIWTALTPLITSTMSLFQGLIIIPYYGRLLVLNTWEGVTTDTYTGATNFYARCRFSQIGDPTDQTNAWRQDIFGRGGYIDAPTNESIVGAAFHRNTLIVFFEYSTWQLRYIGEYGIPFIFERISSDFGSTSTFSQIVFDRGVYSVGGRGIIQAGANGVVRLDEQIPETVFSFDVNDETPSFVHGIRDFEKEVVYWNYLDESTAEGTQIWPNTTLLYNYQNNTWAQFRDTITCFGTGQFQFGITWDSLTTLWDDAEVTWDNVDDQQYVDYVLAGNQQGFISIYENQDAAVETTLPSVTNYSPTLAITAFDFSDIPTEITIPNHNLANGEIIYIQGTLWSTADPGINNQIYNVSIIDVNTITLGQWNNQSKNYGAVTIATETYIGGGLISLLPRMNIVGKDFNPFQSVGKQFKLSYIDFQCDSSLASPAIPAVSIQLFVNSYLGTQANLLLAQNDPSYTNQEVLLSAENVGMITNVQLTNPCIVTSPNHDLETGQIIYIANVLGTTQINQTLYIITEINENNFSLNGIDATGWTTYVAGGIWNTNPVDGQSFTPGAEYAWYRFYSNQFGQYLRIAVTYDDTLMNQVSTHQIPFELNAMNCWFRTGARLVN